MAIPRHHQFACLLASMLVLAAPLAAADDLDQKSPEAKQALMELSREVEKHVEELRGWKFKHPVKTDVRTKEELVKFVKRKINEDYGPGRISRKQAGLRMTGVIPTDCDLMQTWLDVLASQVGGFYDPEKKTFYMMVRKGMSHTGAMGRIVIAHELTHALDDQYIDLQKMLDESSKTEDAELAIGAVVEGSATVLMTRYITTAPYNKTISPEELAESAAAEMESAQGLIDSPRYFSLLMANYICGMNFMTKADQGFMFRPDAGEAMQKNLLKAAKNPPRSAEQILHPEKYWDENRRDEPVVVDDKAVTARIEQLGWKVAAVETFGEAICAVLTQPVDEPLSLMGSQLPNYWTTPAATGWGGDRLFILSKQTFGEDDKLSGDLAAVWVTAWDSDEDCQEFAEDYDFERDIDGMTVTQPADRLAVFYYNVPKDGQDALNKWFESRPEIFRQDGRPWSAKQP